MTDLEQAAEIRREMSRIREITSSGVVWLQLNEDECVSVAAGVVPPTVRAMAMMGCEDVFRAKLEANAAKPPRRAK